MRARNTLSLSIVLFSLACASPPPVAPVNVGPVAPSAGEKVVVDQSILIVDASSSVADEFPGEKAMVQSLVASMPEGSYEAGSIVYGGFRRDNQPLAPLNRSALRNHANSRPLRRSRRSSAMSISARRRSRGPRRPTPMETACLRARGFGETKPVAPNDSPEDLQRNRRTELNPFGE